MFTVVPFIYNLPPLIFLLIFDFLFHQERPLLSETEMEESRMSMIPSPRQNQVEELPKNLTNFAASCKMIYQVYQQHPLYISVSLAKHVHNIGRSLLQPIDPQQHNFILRKMCVVVEKLRVQSELNQLLRWKQNTWNQFLAGNLPFRFQCITHPNGTIVDDVYCPQHLAPLLKSKIFDKVYYEEYYNPKEKRMEFYDYDEAYATVRFGEHLQLKYNGSDDTDLSWIIHPLMRTDMKQTDPIVIVSKSKLDAVRRGLELSDHENEVPDNFLAKCLIFTMPYKVGRTKHSWIHYREEPVFEP